jgi:hypothetical protein
MAYCPNCGQSVSADAKFCPNCGASLTAATSVPAAGTYSVILVSLNTCNEDTAADIFADLFGYTDAETAQIKASLPTQLAGNLTKIQADTIARSLTEYGMQVAVYNGSEYVDTDNASSSVFNSDGSFTSAALAVLGTLTAANLVHSFRRWPAEEYRVESPFSHLYHLLFHPRPPRHVRRPCPWQMEPEPHRFHEPVYAAPRRQPHPDRGMGPDHRGGRGGGPGGHGGHGGRGGRP